MASIGDYYPTDEDLARIREWPSTDLEGLLAFVRSLWWAADVLWKTEGRKAFISTGGWSGTESLIGAMQENLVFWAMCWESGHKGGHFEFALSEDRGPQARL
jgi:hypothetical protein